MCWPNQIYFRTFLNTIVYLFMKTTNIPVYGNIAVYINYCAVCLTIDYTPICLDYVC